jgi:hypothetical protein
MAPFTSEKALDLDLAPSNDPEAILASVMENVIMYSDFK